MTKNKYSKLPKTYTEQIKILQNRNIKIDDTQKILKFIKHINYYRFSAYCIPFETSRHNLSQQINIKNIQKLYEFDRKLRLLLDEILEIIEISLKANLAYYLSHKYGAFAHTISKNFFINKDFNHQQWLENINLQTEKSKEIFITHYKNKYYEYPNLPIWMLVEVISFGSIVRLIKNLKKDDLTNFAKEYNMYNYKIFFSWILAFNYIRNLCAHFGRLIEKDLSITIKIPNKMNLEKYLNDKKIGIILLVVNIFVQKNISKEIFDLNAWKKKVELLLNEHENENIYKLIGLKCKLQNIPDWICHE